MNPHSFWSVSVDVDIARVALGFSRDSVAGGGVGIEGFDFEVPINYGDSCGFHFRVLVWFVVGSSSRHSKSNIKLQTRNP